MQFGFNGAAYSLFWFFRGDTPMLDQWIPADVCLFLAIATYYYQHKRASDQTNDIHKEHVKEHKNKKA
jgi:hypothetical protein